MQYCCIIRGLKIVDLELSSDIILFTISVMTLNVSPEYHCVNKTCAFLSQLWSGALYIFSRALKHLM